MAFKLDFNKLIADAAAVRAMSPEDRAQHEAREEFSRNVNYVVKDERDRDAASKELRVITLVEHPSARSEMDGSRFITLYHGVSSDAPALSAPGSPGLKRALFRTSEAERLESRALSNSESRERTLMGLGAGDKVTVLGEERSRRWKNDRTGSWSTVTQFHAQRVGVGEMTREQLMARTPGGLAEAAERHAAASTDRERDAVVRAYLGQDPARGGLAAQVASLSPGTAPVTAKGPSRDDGAAVAAAALRGGQGR